ncbi:acyltransferase [Ancylothrix sp. C2]|uniref:acyltransferase family protein n=1 Tax=Ancylothrix sp. D3o TaxID=2953691 RepID=UPI0021BA66A8|nr:acyltransferase [Ancylothrix sp. D3o]MCT7951896.1 acyltransferase [Ancylothrix sp. D3o]
MSCGAIVLACDTGRIKQAISGMPIMSLGVKLPSKLKIQSVRVSSAFQFACYNVTGKGYFLFLSVYKMSSQKIHLKKLDSLRGLASLYVVLHNLVYGLYGLDMISENWKLLFFAGQEAVMLFFLISGFVIYLSTHQKNLDFRSFCVRRFRRIYFPFLLSILLSIIIFYFNGNLAEKFSWQELIGNLLLLQDFGRVKPGNWFSPFLGNLPLWSLSYEWWFYMLFYPIYKFLPESKRLYIILAFSACCYLIFTAYPNHLCLVGSYLIIWWG